MQEVIRFALLGLGLGSLYALASQGLIVIYRGSGILNFAHGAVGMVGAYVAWELQVNQGVPFLLALLAAIAASTLIGVATHVLVMRPLRRASQLARIVATLGVLIVLQSIAILRYGTSTTIVQSSLPTTVIHLGGSITISADRLILLGIACALSLILWAAYRFSSFGVGTTAVAENQRAAASLGWSPDVIAAVNWGLGSGLAAAAATLISPIVELQPATMTSLVLAAMAAALVAGFRSFPLALLAGVVIGIVQSELQRYVQTPGVASSVPFAVIIVVMALRGQALPLRDFFLQRLPSVGSGRVRPLLVLASVAALVALIATVSPAWQDALTVTLGVALILLSLVVVTGYAGQVSLAQYTIGGVGAYVAGRFDASLSVPFWLAAIIGVVGTVPIAMLFALPAVRTRGVNLAIVTFGLASAIELILFDNPNFTGGFAGTTVNSPSLAGLSFDPIVHTARYGFLAAGAFVLGALAVANVRRGRSGRRMLAVRANERAATALGISVPSVKLYAFGLSGAIAALGGIILAFDTTSILYSEFTAFTSVTAVGWAVIGGIGYLVGPIIGAGLAPGSIGTQISYSIFADLAQYVPLIGGGVLILMILQNQDGLAKEQINQLQWLHRRARRLGGRGAPSPALAAVGPASGTAEPERAPAGTRTPARAIESPRGAGDGESAKHRVVPRTLSVEGLSVHYGGVVAVSDVTFSVPPGQIVGLIGPNGAGKTTVIDAITGFANPAAGRITLDTVDIRRLAPFRRARAGISRSFQSLELFDDMTVIENLRAAADPRDRLSYLRDLVYPVAPPLPGEVLAAIEAFGLADVLDLRADVLPYGRRRQLAIARAVATKPSVLLLDEPAAGLSDVESTELARLVRQLPDDWEMGVLLVEHDMDFVMSVCDHIVVLDFGAKIAEGDAETVRRDARVIAAYLGVAGADETNGEVPVETTRP